MFHFEPDYVWISKDGRIIFERPERKWIIYAIRQSDQEWCEKWGLSRETFPTLRQAREAVRLAFQQTEDPPAWELCQEEAGYMAREAPVRVIRHDGRWSVYPESAIADHLLPETDDLQPLIEQLNEFERYFQPRCYATRQEAFLAIEAWWEEYQSSSLS